jgi:hypothetical protein
MLKAAAATLAAGCASGCAIPIIGGLTLNELSTGTSIISTGLTGKSLSEHGLDLVTGKDCNLMEAAFHDDRSICEQRGSPATAGDFTGLIGLLATHGASDAPIQRVAIVQGEGDKPAGETQDKARAKTPGAIAGQDLRLTDAVPFALAETRGDIVKTSTAR